MFIRNTEDVYQKCCLLDSREVASIYKLLSFMNNYVLNLYVHILLADATIRHLEWRQEAVYCVHAGIHL